MRKIIYSIIFLWWLNGLLLGVSSLQAQAQLDEYLVLAAKQNPSIKAAYASFEAELQQVPQVKSLPDPTLTISAFGRMIETRLGTQEARFSLMQMFPWFGTNKLKGDAAGLRAEAAFQNYLAIRKRVFLDLKSTYFELYALDEMIQLKEQNVAVLASLKEQAIQRFKSGQAPMVNAVKVDIQKDAALSEIEWLKEERLPLQVAFNNTIGREIEVVVELPDTLALTVASTIFSVKEREELLSAHPSITELKKKEAALALQKQLAKKEGYPNFGLGLDYSIISKRPVENLEMNGRDAIMPMVTLSLPIYRKKYRALEKEASLKQESIVYEEESQLNTLVNSYQSAAYQLQRANRQLALYDRQIGNAQQALKLLLTGFSNGLSDFEEVLQMNQDLLMYEIAKVEALKAGLIAEAELHYLLMNEQEDTIYPVKGD